MGLPSMESVRRRQVVLWLRERCGISHPVGYSYVELAVKRGMAEMVDEKTVRFQSPSSGMTVEGVDPVRIAELGLDRAYGQQDWVTSFPRARSKGWVRQKGKGRRTVWSSSCWDSCWQIGAI